MTMESGRFQRALGRLEAAVERLDRLPPAAGGDDRLAAFEEFGPFDERVAIGEEWPILAGLYRARPGRLV